MTKFFKLFQDCDFLTGILTLCIASFCYAGVGDDMKDWVFPLMACYTLFSVSTVFLIKSLIKLFQNSVDKNVIILNEQIPSIINVIFFSFIVFGFLIVLFAFGFWIASFLFLWVSITYFNVEKNFSNSIKSLVISLIACGVAYVVFTHIFYVPFPESRIFG